MQKTRERAENRNDEANSMLASLRMNVPIVRRSYWCASEKRGAVRVLWESNGKSQQEISRRTRKKV